MLNEQYSHTTCNQTQSLSIMFVFFSLLTFEWRDCNLPPKSEFNQKNDQTQNMSEVQLTITWLKDKSKINLSLPAESTLRELKQRLFELTRVVPDKQKYLGLKLKKSGSKPNDDTTLEMFQSKNNTLVFQLMGTPDAEIVEKNRKVDLMFVIVEQEVADVEKQVMNIR